MKNTLIYLAVVLGISSCATPAIIQLTDLGDKPAEVLQTYTYALPQTLIKVELEVQELTHVPGPYWESANKYLGITEVIQQKSSQWSVLNVKVTAHHELDPGQVYTLNLMEGEVDWGFMDPLLEKGIILDGSGLVHAKSQTYIPNSSMEMEYQRYLDLGIYSNFEERTETMYKTIVTDTSFERVPVDRTIIEQKSPAIKASEAADFILDLRERRFDMLTGEYEIFPQGVAMETAIAKLDQLEASYLSLFTGKTLSRKESRSYFIVPLEGQELSRYRLGNFSEQLGFVPEELMEGEVLEISISPSGDYSVLADDIEELKDGPGGNYVIYRVPAVSEIKVMLGDRELSNYRTSIYQAGGFISTPLAL